MANVCIITGAGSGIGRATAIQVSNIKDYDVIVLIGRTKETLEQTKKMMNQNKIVDTIVFDLLNLQEIPNLIRNIYNKYNSINTLLNIAGFTDPQPLLTTSLESMTKLMKLMFSHLLCL